MKKDFLVEVSARHVHLDRAAMDMLFGAGSELTKKRDLSQPGEFLCEERVDVIGPKNTISRVSVLGPLRNATQVEVSMTDSFALGIPAPIRESGDVAGAPGVKLRGAAGEMELKEGLIVAKRHVHMRSADAAEFGVENKQIVNVAVKTAERSTVFGDVVIRVNDAYGLSMHIDTDEGNAAGVGRDGARGVLVDVEFE